MLARFEQEIAMFRDARIGMRRSVAFWWLLALAAAATLLIAQAAGAGPPSLPTGAAAKSISTSDSPESADKAPQAATAKGNEDEDEDERPVIKTNAEWKKLLTRKQYRVARQGETEPPFKGKYWKNKEPGSYRCVCCDAELFSSQAKFESGTGWPSFWAPTKDKRLQARQDYSDGSLRVEVLCTRCGAHLGHVFSDGPPPTGLRFCINSASLNFAAAEHFMTDEDQQASGTIIPVGKNRRSAPRH